VADGCRFIAASRCSETPEPGFGDDSRQILRRTWRTLTGPGLDGDSVTVGLKEQQGAFSRGLFAGGVGIPRLHGPGPWAGQQTSPYSPGLKRNGKEFNISGSPNVFRGPGKKDFVLAPGAPAPGLGKGPPDPVSSIRRASGTEQALKHHAQQKLFWPRQPWEGSGLIAWPAARCRTCRRLLQYWRARGVVELEGLPKRNCEANLSGRRPLESNREGFPSAPYMSAGGPVGPRVSGSRRYAGPVCRASRGRMG